MKLILYSVIVFIVALLFQIFLIIILEKKRRKRILKISVEDEYRKNMQVVIKFLLAIIISITLAIISFYGIGILTIIELREGH